MLLAIGAHCTTALAGLCGVGATDGILIGKHMLPGDCHPGPLLDNVANSAGLLNA
jgi:hypothetical protein